MDLSKVSNKRKLHICRRYFETGLLFLPMLWAVNTFWFFNEAFVKPAYEEQKQIRKYVIYSAIGSIIWIIILAIWITVFQLHRAKWGEFGDSITFIIPLGKA